MGVSKMDKNLFLTDDLRVPLFQETSICDILLCDLECQAWMTSMTAVELRGIISATHHSFGWTCN